MAFASARGPPTTPRRPAASTSVSESSRRVPRLSAPATFFTGPRATGGDAAARLGAARPAAEQRRGRAGACRRGRTVEATDAGAGSRADPAVSASSSVLDTSCEESRPPLLARGRPPCMLEASLLDDEPSVQALLSDTGLTPTVDAALLKTQKLFQELASLDLTSDAATDPTEALTAAAAAVAELPASPAGGANGTTAAPVATVEVPTELIEGLTKLLNYIRDLEERNERNEILASLSGLCKLSGLGRARSVASSESAGSTRTPASSTTPVPPGSISPTVVEDHSCCGCSCRTSGAAQPSANLSHVRRRASCPAPQSWQDTDSSKASSPTSSVPLSARAIAAFRGGSDTVALGVSEPVSEPVPEPASEPVSEPVPSPSPVPPARALSPLPIQARQARLAVPAPQGGCGGCGGCGTCSPLPPVSVTLASPRAAALTPSLAGATTPTSPLLSSRTVMSPRGLSPRASVPALQAPPLPSPPCTPSLSVAAAAAAAAARPLAVPSAGGAAPAGYPRLVVESVSVTTTYNYTRWLF
eukprot:TRINITY_DN1784_c1_g1_i1.p1 TRINITY_DN1784_c1_g1~~TRINITY_DN1784_c1_g1_i1.p1  ORF type:complete len:556 (-),score=107.58 TRINITY_DN1784_c1_g1_i1:193-1785(-)